MKILRLAYEWPPPWDGLASGIYELTQAQIALGNRVEVFSSKRFPRALKRFSLFLTTAPAVLAGYLIYRLGHKIDLVHGHGHITACFNLHKLIFGWLDKTPYTLHLHITAAGRRAQAKERGTKLNFWTRYFEWPLHKFSDRLGCRVADAVICVSEAVRREAIKYCQADPGKVFVVENGVNVRLFAPRTESKKQQTKNVLYVGALSERKNAYLLVEAMKYLSDRYRLAIVGRGSREYEEQLHRLVKKLKLQERVGFEGYVEYPKLPALYQGADLLVLPSSYEGFPKVVLESLACGTPVLASGFEIKESISGLYFLGNIESGSLAAEIKRIVEGRGRVDVGPIREKYSWEVKAEEIQKIYDKIRKR